jgi:2-amino-4-hydroxy-6-hydroxymethyldihydropteridine diphosphokinase
MALSSLPGRVFIAVGANLPHPVYGPPVETLPRALDRLQAEFAGRVLRRSSWYRSAPVPPSGQPWFINAVAELDTGMDPAALLAALHRVEDAFGRSRRERNEARLIDLDLIDFRGQVSPPPGWPVLPHPRCHERAFVLHPLREIAPDWLHPVTGDRIDVLIGRLPPGQAIERLPDGPSHA